MATRNTVIENEFACLWFYPKEGIIHHQFRQPVAGEAFRGVLLNGLKLMKEHHASKWLSDDRANSILPAEDSAWSQDFWLPQALQAGWKYWALLPPAKLRGQVNMKRLMEYIGERHKVGIEIFSEPAAAWHWLVQQGSVCK